MSAHELHGGVPLGARQIMVTEVVTYPVAVVTVATGGDGIGDATHHLKIVLPNQAREIRIPFNQPALRNLAREVRAAGEITNNQRDQLEGSET